MQFIVSATSLYTRVVKSVCDMFIDLRHFGGYNPTYSERVAVSIESNFQFMNILMIMKLERKLSATKLSLENNMPMF